ncbi:lytic transglycosylase domain-containing protein [Streptomyces sp. NPDC006700]|uniref:lytic transglycosylase domain-containing protein n=1 Tax=Streptomyces sp. NPDC006700 TaxID=3154479 RepID=UPI0033D0B55D
MTVTRSRRRGPAVVLVVLLAAACYGAVRAAGGLPSGSAPRPVPAVPSPSPASPTAPARPSATATAGPYDPADQAAQVRLRAGQAGISARLLMAILYNESYKPHEPGLERAWQKYKPDAAFGIANMHRTTYDATKKDRDFANRSWDELPDDRDLAVEAAAWYLHDLAAVLPAQWAGPYSRNDLLALGYNTGQGNMLAFARGATPGSQARSYLDELHAHWAEAGRAVGS